MRDLNLGPDTRKLINRWSKAGPAAGDISHEMAAMLERWITVAWCWPDACPAAVCAGPHVKVRYEDDRMGSQKKPVEVIEPYNKIGTTFPEVPYHVINA